MRRAVLCHVAVLAFCLVTVQGTKRAIEIVNSRLAVHRRAKRWVYTPEGFAENEPKDPIMTVQCREPPSDIVYHLDNVDAAFLAENQDCQTNEDIKDWFKMVTGVTDKKKYVGYVKQTQPAKNYDREMYKCWYMVVSCTSDDPNYVPDPNQIVRIPVLDQNDNKPYVLDKSVIQNVSESAEINDVVFTIQTNDLDDPATDYNGLVYVYMDDTGVDAGAFSIDEKTGQVKLLRKLDYEVQKNLQFQVLVMDREGKDYSGDKEKQKSSTKIITVRVLDANDYAPVIDKSHDEVTVKEDTAIGTCVLTIEASDQDTGDNKAVYFRIDNEELQKTWAMKNTPSTTGVSTGCIIVNGVVDYETADADKMVAITVYAYNIVGGKIDDQHMDYHDFMITIADVNEAPIFQKEPYRTTINEQIPIGTPIYTVQAVDNDFADNPSIPAQSVKYTIYKPEENWFKIDQAGTISTIAAIDREKLDSLGSRPSPTDRNTLYQIKVQAQDNYDGEGGSKSSFAIVNVTIIDFNDNPPYLGYAYGWNPDDKSISICHKDRPFSNVTWLEAYDPDTADGMPYKFRFTNLKDEDTWSFTKIDGSKVWLNTTAAGAELTPNTKIKINITISDSGDENANSAKTGYDLLTVKVCECNDNYEFVDGCAAALGKGGLTIPIIIAILVIIILIIIILAAVIYKRKKAAEDVKGGLLYEDEDDVRENLQVYHDEGGGEEDQDAYDITALRQPLEEPRGPRVIDMKPVESAQPQPRIPRNIPGDDIEKYIDDAKSQADKDPTAPPFDSLLVFDYEGTGSDAGSLSSLNSGTTDGSQNYDHLNDWGPRFRNLADMYGQGSDSED